MFIVPSDFTLPPRQNRPLAIAHVNVLPMDEKRLLTDQTVILEDGYIRTLGPAYSIDVTDMQQIDGSKKYLLPGLADMHVHYRNQGENPDEFAMFLANGVTLVRNMWGRPDHLALAQQTRQGHWPSPRIVTTSPIIDGSNAKGETVHPGSILFEDPSKAHELVAAYAARGYQQIKIYSQLTLPALQALGKAAAEFGLRMTGHCPYRVTYEEAIAAGVSCFEHLTSIENGHLKDNVPPLNFWPDPIAAYRQRLALIDYDAIRRLAQYMAKEQIWNCPTMTVYQPRAIEQSLLMQNPWLQYEFPRIREQWLRVIQRTEHTEDWLQIGRDLHEMHLRIVSILHEEGAPLLLGTDTPNPFVYQGFSLHQELENLVHAGLSSYEALCCGTCEAARFLGESAIWGTISAGKRADLLLTSTNPLDNIAAVRNLEAVFVNGFTYTREKLAALLRQRADVVASLEETATPTPVLEATEVDSDQILRQGTLLEQAHNHERGRIAYRHSKWDNDTLLIEERYGNIRRTRQDTVRLVLVLDGVIQRGEVRQETSLGIAIHTIARLAEGGYKIHSKDVDGYETSTILDQPALIPDERLSITTMPLALAALRNNTTSLLALGFIGEELKVIRIEVSPTTPENSSTALLQQWDVIVEHPGQTILHHYQIAPDQTLVSMQLEWHGRIWSEIKALTSR